VPYVIEELADDLFRIELSKYEGLAEPINRPTNVYLVAGQAPALIGAGHPTQFKSLCAALRELDVSPSRIERIIHTSWDVDVLAGATNFADVDHFVLSPDMVKPSDYEGIVERTRRRLSALALDIAAALPQMSFHVEHVEHNLLAYYPPMPRKLRFIPLTEGIVIRAAGLDLEVMDTPGPGPGQCCLFARAHQMLFSGAFALQGIPPIVEDVERYLESLERLFDLDVGVALPTHGDPDVRGKDALFRSLRFFNSFLGGVPIALAKAPTLFDFIEQDQGYLSDDLLELTFTFQRYKTLFDELERLKVIQCEGTGFERRYGVNVDDPREGLRR
jgi:glyoxylase-like metal-dependent hydrolase (beta-lactamase superfamily II)